MSNSAFAVDPSPQLDYHVSSAEAARILGLKEKLLVDWRSQGRGPRYRKFHKLVRYSIADLREFAEAGIVDPSHQEVSA